MKHGYPMSPQKVSNSPCSGVTHHPLPKKKFKQTLSARKIICTVFWERYGVLLLDYCPNGQTINAQVYFNTLQRLRRAIQNKCRGLLSSGVVLLHDNACPHTAWQTTALLQQFRCDIMDHPPYSLDLVPSDYHLFLHMKRFLAGKQFHSDAEVKTTVNNWLQQQAVDFFDTRIQKLLMRYNKCLDSAGDYAEKLCFELPN